jgi:hypothetical protein
VIVLGAAVGLVLASIIRVVRIPGRPHSPASPPSPASAATVAEGAGAAASARAPEQAQGAGNPASSPLGAGSGCVLLVVAVGCAMLAVIGYKALRDWHRPVQLTASAGNQGILQPLTLTSGNSGTPVVHWSVDGAVWQLQVRGTNSGTAQVILPLARSACPAVARQLKLPGTSCAGRQLSMSSPAKITWSSPQILTSSQMNSRELAITPLSGPKGRLGMIVQAQTKTRPSVCFSPAGAVTLRLTDSSGHYTTDMTASGTFRCDDRTGLALLIGHGRRGSPPAFEFDGVSYVTVNATAPAASLQGFEGQITLNPGPKTILARPTPVSLGAMTSASLAFDVELNVSNPAPAGQPPLVTSPAVTSVLTGNGELVPSEWDRDPGVIAPLLGGLVSVLVLTPLGASMRAFFNSLNRRVPPLIDLLKRWTRRFRARAWPIKKTRKERHAL